jgi:uncharacterized protein
MTNKKINQAVNKTFNNGNIDAFLAYCTYDVRWYAVGSHDLKRQNVFPQFMKEIHGETPSEIIVNQMVGEGNSVICEALSE